MNRLLIVAAAGTLAFLAFARPKPAAAPLQTTAFARPRQVIPNSRAFARVVVYVAGAVSRSGLYRVRDGARIDDALQQAGGFASDADRAGVNLAERVQDGEEIRVPRIGEETPAPRRSRGTARRSKSKRHRSHRHPSAGQNGLLNLNTAGVDDLAQLPGVGATLAARIVEYRRFNGRFISVDELADVAGFTQRRVDDLARYLSIGTR